MTFYDHTGEVISHYGPEENMVLDVGIESMWQRLGTIDSVNNFQLNTIAFGDDFGDPTRWSIFNPEPPSRSFTGANQNVTHTLPSVTFTYPTDDVLQVTADIDGTTFMDTNFPTDVSYDFTSMTLRFINNTAFAFKRFPIRSISRYIRLKIDWRFTLVNAEEFCDGGAV